MSDGHRQVVRGDLGCLDCHSPHASKSEKGLLVAGAHAPMAQGKCEACHTMEDGKPATATVAQPPALCITCHKDLADFAKRKVLHEGVTDGDCTSCHEPHGSKMPGLLAKPAKELCGECHDDIAAKFGEPVVHQAFTDEKCGACHEVHGGSNPKLVRTTDGAMCLRCHKDLGARLTAGKGTHPPAGEARLRDVPHAARRQGAAPPQGRRAHAVHDLPQGRGQEARRHAAAPAVQGRQVHVMP